MVWYSHLLKNFPQFVVIHIVKGFGVVNKAEVDGFLELSCFFDDPTDIGNLISGSPAFRDLNPGKKCDCRNQIKSKSVEKGKEKGQRTEKPWFLWMCVLQSEVEANMQVSDSANWI